MNERTEVLLSDLGALCAPADRVSPRRHLGRWNAVPYETDTVRGTMLTALGEARPDEVTLDPSLTGWYRIYVGIPFCWLSGPRTDVELKLSEDGAFCHFSHDLQGPLARTQIQEAFWRCADMTGQHVTVGKPKHGKAMDALLAWLRFVPMTQAEVTAFRADRARADTKRIYAANDMHGMLCLYGARSREDWRGAVQEYLQSDVEWLSLEDIGVFDGEVSTGDADDFAFPRPADGRAQRLLKPSFTREMLQDVIAFGHEQGLKMCLSLRMGPWAMEFPLDQMLFDNSFFRTHPTLRCLDRDGHAVSALSYAYPEVQDYVISRLVQNARLGADAVELIATRGLPYLLFEPPVIDAFRQTYGEDPRFLPQDDPRYLKTRCALMTGFFRRLRAALDTATGKGVTAVHLRSMYSVYDSFYAGFDLEALARDRLIDAVISYPQRCREKLTGDVWQDEEHTRLDLDKYTRYCRQRDYPLFSRPSDFVHLEPDADVWGCPHGPADPAQRVAELTALEDRYGVRVYFEILPRVMPPGEMRARALELYRLGAGRFSLWDACFRAPARVCWTAARRLGHRKELEADSGEGTLYRYDRLLTVGGLDVSRYTPSWGG